MPQSFCGSTDLRLDVLDLKTTRMLAFDAREQIPDPFVRSQRWCRARQAFEMNPCGSPLCHKIVDGVTAMNHGTVPDHQHVAGNLACEQRHTANHIRAVG